MPNVFVTGMTGTGKSYAIQSILKDIDKQIIGVSNKEEDLIQLEELTGRDFIKVVVNNKTRLKDLPDKDVFFIFGFMTHNERIKFMDDLATLVYTKKKNVILYVDEAHDVLPESKNRSKMLESLIAGSRVKKIDVILITQRPQTLLKSALNNTVYRMCFKLTEDNSVKSMVKHLEKVTADDIKNLEKYEFILYNAYTGEIRKNKL